MEKAMTALNFTSATTESLFTLELVHHVLKHVRFLLAKRDIVHHSSPMSDSNYLIQSGRILSEPEKLNQSESL